MQGIMQKERSEKLIGNEEIIEVLKIKKVGKVEG